MSYLVSTIAAAWSIGLKFSIDIFSSNAKKLQKAISLLVFVIILPLTFIFTLQGIIPISIPTEAVARAGFSAIFGVSVSVGYDLIKA